MYDLMIIFLLSYELSYNSKIIHYIFEEFQYSFSSSLAMSSSYHCLLHSILSLYSPLSLRSFDSFSSNEFLLPTNHHVIFNVYLTILWQLWTILTCFTSPWCHPRSYFYGYINARALINISKAIIYPNNILNNSL